MLADPKNPGPWPAVWLIGLGALGILSFVASLVSVFAIGFAPSATDDLQTRGILQEQDGLVFALYDRSQDRDLSSGCALTQNNFVSWQSTDSRRAPLQNARVEHTDGLHPILTVTPVDGEPVTCEFSALGPVEDFARAAVSLSQPPPPPWRPAARR